MVCNWDCLFFLPNNGRDAKWAPRGRRQCVPKEGGFLRSTYFIVRSIGVVWTVLSWGGVATELCLLEAGLSVVGGAGAVTLGMGETVGVEQAVLAKVTPFEVMKGSFGFPVSENGVQ